MPNMQIIKRGFVLWSLLLIASLSWGQVCNLTVEVTVQDSLSGEELMNVVLASKSGVSLITLENGKAIFKGQCPGNWTISTSHLGYLPKEVILDIQNDFQLKILLVPDQQLLDVVTIAGVREEKPQIREEIKDVQLFGTRGLSLAQALQQVNGVRLLSTGAGISKPIISGMHSNRIVILNHGVRLESQQWGTDHAPEIDPFSAGKLTVIKGASTVKYGPEAMGGVIEVEPEAFDFSKKMHGEIQLAGFSNNKMGVLSGMTEWNHNNLGLRLQGTLKKGGNIQIPGYRLANTGVEENNLSFLAQYRSGIFTWRGSFNLFSTQIGLYSGAHLENLDDLNNAIQSPFPLIPGDFTYQIDRPNQTVQHLTGKIQGTAIWNDRHSTKFGLSVQENRRKEFDLRSFIENPELNLRLISTTADVQHSIFWTENLTWENGMSLSYQQNINDPTSSRIFIRNYESLLPALYSILSLKKGLRWTHEIGARYDYRWFQSYYRNNDQLILHEREFSNATFTVGTLYRPFSTLTISGNIASAWRPPAPNELYANGLHQGIAAIEKGNQDFAQEESIHLGLKVDWRPDTTFSISVDLNQNRISNYIYLQPVLPPALTINGYYPLFEYRQTNAQLFSSEVQFSWMPVSWIEFGGKGSWIRAKDRIQKDWIIFMPADRYEISSTFKPRNNGEFVTLSLIHTGQQTRIPTSQNGSIDYADPPKGFVLLNIDAGVPLTKSGIFLGISVYNLTNTSYREYLNRLRYFADEAGWNAAVRLKIPIS
jgi:iron complex outermembrane recepter protein